MNTSTIKQHPTMNDLFSILNNKKITEIIFHPEGFLNFEFNGELKFIDSKIWKTVDAKALVAKMIEALPRAPNYEHPICSGIWKNFRLQVIAPPVIHKGLLIQLRRLSDESDFKSFNHQDWQARPELTHLLEKKVKFERENFLIIGPTGCGKTTLLKSLLLSFCRNDRIVCLEDTPELPKVNNFSTHLKTYSATSDELNDIELHDLIKASLRLRPDRLMMGEMRGEEAASFLLMLSTGHRGSGATLHAHNAHDALRRLEMLIQMGGTNWNLQTVRQLIYSSLNFIISMGRTSDGNRCISKVSRIEGLEDHGFLIHDLYENT